MTCAISSKQKRHTDNPGSQRDLGAFNHEIDQKKQDAGDLETTRRRMHRQVGGMPHNPTDTEGQA